MQLTPKKVLNNGVEYWMVEYPPVDGKRPREFFKSEKEADAAVSEYKKKVKRAGEWWTRLGENTQMAIQVVVTEILDAGKTMGEVWEGYKKKEKATAEIKTPITYQDCVSEWKRRKLGVGADEQYVLQAGIDLMKFGAGKETHWMHEIPMTELQDWILAQRIKKPGKDFGKPWSKSTKKTWISLFHGLWKVAIAMKGATENIVDSLEPIKRTPGEKKIYSIEVEKQILAACLETEASQKRLITPVLGLFGCMRPDEISSDRPKRKNLPKEKWFGWHCIDLEKGQINVSKDVAKKEDERVITLEPVAIEWLKLCQKIKCPLPPVGEFRLRGEICQKIGLVEDEKERDGFRKTCATHLRAIKKNDYLTGQEMGHSARVLIRNYAALKIPMSQSLEHWMISPEVINIYRKSREWKRVLLEAEEKFNAKTRAEEAAISASSETPAKRVPSANETAKSEN
jgi:hypothetical protein